MAKIRKAVFRSGIVMLSLLAAIVLSSSVAQAQRCIAQVKGGSETVRAEGMTEVVGNLELRCWRPAPSDGTFGFEADIPSMFDISVELTADITNELDEAGNVMLAPDGLGYKEGGITLTADRLPRTGTFNPDNGGNNIPAADFGNGELSDGGNMITWEEIPQVNLNFDGDNNGFNVVISGIRANAASVGDGGEIMANVMVNGTNINTAPLKAADVMNGLAVKATVAMGLQCSDSADMTMSTITIQEGFRTAIVNGDSLVVAFSGIPDGMIVMVPNKVDLAMMDNPEGGSQIPDPAAFSLTLSPVSTDVRVEVELEDGSGKVKYNIGETADGATVGADEWVNLPVYFSWETGGEMPVMLGAGSVTVSFDPVSTDPDDDDIPRFVASMDSDMVIEIGECATSLLFPFVTNIYGFDTGIALTNTSAADGPCTISYSGNDMSPADDQEVMVMAGKTATFVVSMMASGFQGFIQAECEFQNAQGFAYITNGFGTMGGATAAQGYLAIQEEDEFGE